MTLLHNKFEEIAKQYPHKIAINHNGEKITYKELDLQSNEVANQLGAQGVKIGSCIGIVMDRSINMFISMLGILKSGSSFLPLESLYPKERINYCLTQSKVCLVIHDGTTSSLVPDNFSKINIEEMGTYNGTPPAINLNDDSLPAYIIYTSGSTGTPKGVVISHKAINNHMNWMQKEFKWTKDDVFLQKTASGFDASIWEIFAPLTTGSLMVIAPSNPFEVANYVSKYKISIVQFVPTVLKIMLENNDLEKLGTLRLIFSGGEPLYYELVKKYQDYLNIPFINLYGPTEATIDTTFHVCMPGDVYTAQIPLGKPISNVNIKVVDQDLAEVNNGTGQLMILGEGLALGYFDMPDKTQEKFIIDPNSGERCYLSGDIVKINHDNSIEFVGREDTQVKLRGLRIEVGEIESRIRQETNVKDAIINIVEENNGLIIAYIKYESHEDLDIQQIKQNLLEFLPIYMIPNYFITLKEFPYLENGKVNRKELFRTPYKNQKTNNETWDEKSTKIKKVWEDLLGQQVNSLYENFQDLGGHSLMAMRLSSKLSKLFGVNLPNNFTYINTSINKQRDYIEKYKSEINSTENFQEINNKYLEAPISMGQQGILFFEDAENKSSYHISFKLILNNEIEFAEILSSIHKLQLKHPMLSTIITRDEEGDFIQRYDSRLINKTINIIETDNKELDIVIEMERSRKFDLSKGAFRYSFIKSSNQKLVLLTFHHVIADGLSTQNFINELDKLLKEKPQMECADEINDSFFEFANNQSKNMYTEGIRFWKGYLKGVPLMSRFPQKIMKQSKQTSRGSRIIGSVPNNLKNKLKNQSVKLRKSEFSFYLSAVSSLLAQKSGQRDLCIGVPIANRRSEQEYLSIGNYVNVIPFRTIFSEVTTIHEIIDRVNVDYKNMLAHDDVPIEKIIPSILTHRSSDYRPLFQVMFVYNRFDNNEDYGCFNLYQAAESTTKCDISFIVEYTATNVELVIEYCTDLFKPEEINLILHEWIQLLVSIVSNEMKHVEFNLDTSNPPISTDLQEYKITNNDIYLDIEVIWKDILNTTGDEGESNFFNLGGHSLLAMKLISLINKKFETNLPVSVIFDYPTINGLSYLIENESNLNNGVVNIFKSNIENKLWFIHPAGGQLWCYNDIAKGLKSNFNIYGIESAPLVNAELIYEDNLSEMAKQYANKILEIQHNGPIHLVGYSFGGVLAYEIGKIIQMRGFEIGTLFLLDCHLTPQRNVLDIELIFSYASKFTNGTNEGISKEILESMDETELLEFLLDLGKIGKHLHRDASTVDVEKGLKIWIANNKAIMSHQLSKGMYKGKTIFIRASQGEQDSSLGWDKHLEEKMTIIEVPAHHFDLYKSPCAELISDLIEKELLTYTGNGAL